MANKVKLANIIPVLKTMKESFLGYVIAFKIDVEVDGQRYSVDELNLEILSVNNPKFNEIILQKIAELRRLQNTFLYLEIKHKDPINLKQDIDNMIKDITKKSDKVIEILNTLTERAELANRIMQIAEDVIECFK